MNWLQRFRKSSAHTQANVICTILIMIATICYTVIAYRTLGRIDSQLGEMRHTNESTQKALDAGSVALHISERAYVGMIDINAIPPIGSPIFPRPGFINSGKGLAIRVEVYAKGVMGIEPPKDPVLNSSVPDVNSAEDIIPNIRFEGEPNKSPATMMDDTTRSALIAGRMHITIYGRIDYRDTFGFQHWIIFCRHSVREGNWQGCGPKFNQSDKIAE